MADEGKPPAGRGSADGRGGQRKAKFAPTVPSQRRRKADEPPGSAGGATSAAEAAAANEAFQDLIRAAQSESKWQRGRGRGYGRGRGGAVAQVMFGGDGNDMRRGPAAVPQPRAAPKPKAEGKPGVKGEAGSSSGRRRLKPNAKPDGADSAGGHTYDDDYEGDDYEDGGQDLASLFDYEQYFPTTLPLPLHHPLDEEADPAADAALMRHGLPDELALRQDDPEGATAAQLGLTDLSTAADTLYLFQLPSLLPLGTNPSADPRKARSAAAAAAAAGSSSGQQQQPLQAANARELPSGQIGKLLVFKSGRVKLQMGPCLLDVSAGMPCVTRQDIAAINKTTGHLIQLGPVTQRVVVCPDVWQLMDDKAVPEFRRDLQQQQHGPLTNGFGRADRGDRMDLDDDEIEEGGELQDEDMGNGVGGGQPKQQRQQVLGGPDLSEDGEGDEQQQGRQEGRQRRLAQQIGSSSEGEADGSQSPVPAAAAAAGGEADAEQQQQQQQQQQQSSAASRAPPRQPNQQQQQFVRNNWLDLPTAPARGAAAGRGRGKFRPSTRSPSPGLAAAAAAAAGSSGLLKQENAMDVDS